MMSPNTRLHADQAGRDIGKSAPKLAARELGLENDGAALVEAD